MLTTFDPAEVRAFTDRLNEKLVHCNGEGRFCNDLDDTLRCHALLSHELLATITEWGERVFRGDLNYDLEVDQLFQGNVRVHLETGRRLSERGHRWDETCAKLNWLPSVDQFLALFARWNRNWISPKLSVAPGPRTKIGEKADRQIRERLALLAPQRP